MVAPPILCESQPTSTDHKKEIVQPSRLSVPLRLFAPVAQRPAVDCNAPA